MNLRRSFIQTSVSLQVVVATLLMIGPLISGSESITAQPSSPSWFLHFSLNAERKPVLCGELDSAGIKVAPRYYEVLYDTLGRPVQISRYFFGNLDSRADWTIQKFKYDTLPSGSTFVRRTWHNPRGFMLQIGIAHGEDVLYDSTGNLLLTTAIDSEGNRVERVNAVTKMTFRKAPDGSYLQGWRYSNNKQFHGSEKDIWGTEFAQLDANAWFRIFRTDENGHLLEERPVDLAQQPVPFPGGELMRRYERNPCGQPLAIHFMDLEGNPMADSSGVAGIAFEYDNNMRLISWRSYDLHGNLKGRKEFGGAARMAREYRQFDGALIREVFYDANGSEIEMQTSEQQPQNQEEQEY